MKLNEALLENHAGEKLTDTKAVLVDPQSGNVLDIVDWDPPCDYTPVPTPAGEAAA